MNETAEEKQLLSGQDALEKIRELLKNFRTTMMVTQNGNSFHSRPMGLMGKPAEFDGTLWFFTDDRSHKIIDVEDGQPVWLIFQNDQHNCYLELAGAAKPSKNKAKMEELYTPLVRTWFPKGLEDPHITLLQFHASEGTFWDSPGGMLQVLAAFTKSVLTGTPGKGGETGELQLS